MLPLGRRRAGALSPLTMLLGLLCLLASTASAAVVGIDFGTLNIKAALVKPGIPLDIVLTKDSKRKEVAAVAFKPVKDTKGNTVALEDSFPERAYGSDALSLQGRFPGEVFPNLKSLLGIQKDSEGAETIATFKERYPALNVEQSEELGTTVFKSSAFKDDEPGFSVEELISMQLANIKRNAEDMAKPSAVDNAVITVPAFYTAEEKRAIVKAAEYAGLNVLSLISDGLAVGLDYAKSRTFPEVTKGEKPEYHVVFDMGAGSTTATVLRFQSKSVKDIGRFNKTVQEVAVQGVGYDRTLGGDAFTTLLMNDFVKKLLTKPVLKSRGTTEAEVKSNGRAMARFFKEAERARILLSANKETSVSFEEILPDIDLRLKITRADFEALASDYVSRVTKPIDDALAMAKLGQDDIKSIIIHGGAQRTPFVQAQLEQHIKDQAKLRSNVNPDESAVFGAAFKAAGLSPSFKVKEIRDSDIAVYPAGLKYLDNDKERKQKLFSEVSAVGNGATTKQVSFKNKENFAFGFFQTVGDLDRSLLRVQAENLTESADQLKSKFGCEKSDMSTKFSIKLSTTLGLPDVTSGSISCEVDESSKSGSVGDSVKGWLGFGKKKDQEPLGEGEEADGPVEQVDATSSASASTTATSSSEAASETPKKRTELIPLKWSSREEGSPQPDSNANLRITQRLNGFDKSDKARYERDEAQNVLESYTYYVRDFLENSDFQEVSTPKEREEISKTLQAVKDWMEGGDLGKASKTILKEKHQDLKKLVEPIKSRRTESTRRPEVIKALQKTLDETKTLITKVQDQAEKAKASIASAATSKETAAPSDPDNLEEDASSTTSAAAASSADANVYANLDLSKIQETYDSVSEWLTEKLAAQEKLNPFEDPVLVTKDIATKSTEIQKALSELIAKAAELNKPKKAKTPPKPKPSKKPKPAEEPVADSDAPPEPVPEPDPLAEEKATESEPPQKDAPKKPKKGEESIEDMMNWMKENKGEKDPGEHPRDEL